MCFIFKDVLKAFDCGVPNGAHVNKYGVGKVRPRSGLVGPEGEYSHRCTLS